MSDLILKSTDPEYGRLIDQFLSTPLRANQHKPAQLVDSLYDILVGTNQTRFGPKPNPEVAVSIRDVLRSRTAEHEPIRLMSPWGSKKNGPDGMDVAEVAAMLQMRRLQEEVSAIYEPGIMWLVGIEDKGGRFFRQHEIRQDPGVETDIVKYVDDTRTLADVLGISYWAVVKPESTYPQSYQFDEEAQDMAEALTGVLTGERGAMQRAVDKGWQGEISHEMIDFYLQSYRKNRPGDSEQVHRYTLARYFAQANTRYRLNMKVPHGWGTDYIQINFAPPVDGAPDHLTKRRLFYRTMPMSHTNNHMPPWRGKGYLCVINGGEVKFKLTNWHTPIEGLVENRVELQREYAKLTIKADYVLQEGGGR